MAIRIAESELTALAANRYWREPDARIALTALDESGMTVAEFAKRYELPREKLDRWRRRLWVDSDDQPTLHPVRVVFDQVAEPAQEQPEPFELVLQGGRRIIVPSNFDDRALRRLVQAVEGWC